MPLPKAGNAQEQEYLNQLYDEYCKIAFKEQLRYYYGPESPHLDLENVVDMISSNSHRFATAMLNERKK